MNENDVRTNAFALKRGVEPGDVLPDCMSYKDGAVTFEVPEDTDKAMAQYAESHIINSFVDTSIRMYQDRAGLEPTVREYQPRGFLHQNRGKEIELDGALLGLVE